MIRRLLAATMLTILAGGCGGPSPRPINPNADSLFDLYMSAASLEFQHDSIPAAAAAYAKALSRAETMDNAADISSAAYSLAICRAALGDYAVALTLLAEAEHESLRSGGATADIWLARARVYLLENNSKQADQSADQVLGGKADDEQRFEALVIRGTARCRSGNLPGAVDDLKQADALLSKVSDRALQASHFGLAGEIHLTSKDFSAAMADFDAQAELCRQDRAYRQMALALTKAGRAALAAEQYQQGADRLYRAARCAPTDADLPSEALAAAQKAGDQKLILLISALAEQSTTQPAAP